MNPTICLEILSVGRASQLMKESGPSIRVTSQNAAPALMLAER
jgi:hypothetical protein